MNGVLSPSPAPDDSPQIAIIIGAGPAGLTAAFELLTRTDIKPIIIEKSEAMGGLSRTIEYRGNRIDIGGHRFFSKSDRVMNWWQARLPLQKIEDGQTVSYQNKSRDIAPTDGPHPDQTDAVMLVRNRKTRIYFLRKFFDYPISLSKDTLSKLGLGRTVRIGFSYLKSVVFPIRREKSLEDFFINRFGRELYQTFFKDYTEKVWGEPCTKISAEWGAQRIKGLSVGRAVAHFVRSLFRRNRDISQKTTETSLIERFLYPKFGPGQMWETVAQSIKEMGGEIVTGFDVETVSISENRISAIEAKNETRGETRTFEGDYFFSTMPIQELVRALQTAIPANVREVSDGLVYRDFITVGMLLNKLSVQEDSAAGSKLIKDTWLYIQEPDVHVGRMQIFNNWSPYLVANPDNAWIGLEYFCYENDALWQLSDEEMKSLAAQEMHKIGIIDQADVLDATVIRVPKTYPAYFGTYNRFDEIRSYLAAFPNLFLIGRNGMHKYNNQDHSMLTAMVAVDNIIEGRVDQSNIWAVNTEQDYHEEKN